jgi:hypothetical protein
VETEMFELLEEIAPDLVKLYRGQMAKMEKSRWVPSSMPGIGCGTLDEE